MEDATRSYKRRWGASVDALLEQHTQHFALQCSAVRVDLERVALGVFEAPQTHLSGWKKRGYQVKVAPAKQWTDTEKDIIEQALQSLNGPDGSAVMGNYKNLANWIATVHLQGTRTPHRVARYLAHLVARLHKSAVEAGKTTHPLPEGIQGRTQLAQDSPEDGSGGETDAETASEDSDMEMGEAANVADEETDLM